VPPRGGALADLGAVERRQPERDEIELRLLGVPEEHESNQPLLAAVRVRARRPVPTPPRLLVLSTGPGATLAPLDTLVEIPRRGHLELPIVVHYPDTTRSGEHPLSARLIWPADRPLLAADAVPVLVWREGAVLRVPEDFPSIGTALDASVDHDRVLVGPGTYVEQVDFAGRRITLRSTRDPEQTVIDGAGTGPVVSFGPGEDSPCVLAGFTVRGGTGYITRVGFRSVTRPRRTSSAASSSDARRSGEAGSTSKAAPPSCAAAWCAPTPSGPTRCWAPVSRSRVRVRRSRTA